MKWLRIQNGIQCVSIGVIKNNEYNRYYKIINLDLYKIKQFYIIILKVPTLSGKLTWSYWYEMLSINDTNKIVYYVRKCELNDKKYNYRNLMSMRKFYLLFRIEKVNAVRS